LSTFGGSRCSPRGKTRTLLAHDETADERPSTSSARRTCAFKSLRVDTGRSAAR